MYKSNVNILQVQSEERKEMNNKINNTSFHRATLTLVLWILQYINAFLCIHVLCNFAYNSFNKVNKSFTLQGLQ